MNFDDYHHLIHMKVQCKSKRTLWLTLILTLFFTFVEIIGGILSHSLALLSDSAHMASDVLALGFSMAALYMAAWKPNKKYTFGFLRFEILASFINGMALTVIAAGIFIEGIKRMISPRAIDLPLMLTVAIIGLMVNIVLTIVLSRSSRQEENLNIKSALWHFIGDLLNSAGVIVSAILIYYTKMMFLDPLISMIIGTVILIGGIKITREAYLILMESVPEKFDLLQIRKDILAIDGVEDVHETHLWTVTTDHYSITAHIFISDECQPMQVISLVTNMLKEKYGLEHSTIQIESPTIMDHQHYGKKFIQTRKTSL